MIEEYLQILVEGIEDGISFEDMDVLALELIHDIQIDSKMDLDDLSVFTRFVWQLRIEGWRKEGL